MTSPEKEQSPYPRFPWMRALPVMLWFLPAIMAVTGIGFILFENYLHQDEPGWPWPTLFGIIVMGLLGPILSWFTLHWALKNAEAYQSSKSQLADRNGELAALNALGLAANSSLDMEKSLAITLEQTMQTMDAKAGMIFLMEKGQESLHLQAQRGFSIDIPDKESLLTPGYCLCGQAVDTRQVLFASDIAKDPRCTSDLCKSEGFRSVVCIPLETKGQLVGLLQLASPHPGHFIQNQVDFLASIARQISVSIENARLYDTVRVFNVELEKKVNQRTRELESARWSLAEKARQLQRLLAESYRVQEDTQARIAHDMHDGVTQIIIGALYETQAARQSLPEDPERALENLSRAQRLLSDVENEIRRVIYDLHPPVLDQMGLVIALKRFAATYQTTFEIECTIDVIGNPHRLKHETEVAIYRIIQAALHNVGTHSQAHHAKIIFNFDLEWLMVTIEDDGIGFDPDYVIKIPGDHLGLIGMKERAESLQADLKLRSSPGKGTHIELLLPAPVYIIGQSE